MPRTALILPLLLAACAASPAPTHFTSTVQSTTVAGRTFTVLRDENRVQVIRHGWASPRERQAIPDQMLLAVAQTTGCTPIAQSFQGNSGERRGRITCPRGR
jgi:hypothetical protein